MVAARLQPQAPALVYMETNNQGFVARTGAPYGFTPPIPVDARSWPLAYRYQLASKRRNRWQRWSGEGMRRSASTVPLVGAGATQGDKWVVATGKRTSGHRPRSVERQRPLWRATG